ncbi:unnamed protein product [Chrysodeixis includens]|uniref:Gustatory receptor n=1 Tax=Chrysodeixis includens TaxID=689277 RepID=A0A9N8Q025_CHRIL|nr:unnamed protein product [Chrysodeixis includens]
MKARHRIFAGIWMFLEISVLTTNIYKYIQQELLTNFDAFYAFFNDVVYNDLMKKAQKHLALIVLMFCVAKMLLFGYMRIEQGDFDRDIGLYFILHSMLFVVSEQLKAIIRSIDKDIQATWTDGGFTAHGETMKPVTITRERLNTLDKWVDAYKNINDSCNLWNHMFRTQGTPSVPTLCLNVFSMVVFMMALLVISRAGQNVQNNSLYLKQKLCQLNVLAVDNEQYYKLTRDLLRCVSSRPCIVHIFGSYDVNMEMLPTCVALFTTYTVIALQFNSVL